MKLRICIALSVALCSGCGFHSKNKIEGEVFLNELSPGKETRLIVSRAGGNATVSNVYRVYAVNQLKDAHPIKTVLSADKLDTIDVRWNSPSEVQISIGCAQIFDYTNFFYVPGAQGGPMRRVAVKMDYVPPCQ
ncbi:MAG: hypothetical protein LBV45_03310 [Xanthomonadaceae bacterium]|jgi:hypothetical protein|nr:hypothetical protein [Xanthomonadaceae bacterium]